MCRLTLGARSEKNLFAGQTLAGSNSRLTVWRVTAQCEIVSFVIMAVAHVRGLPSDISGAQPETLRDIDTVDVVDTLGVRVLNLTVVSFFPQHRAG